jgi:hypothetical protein
MNCAVHPETTATAYCRTCGKAMCSACVRTVKGVVYCEDCIATRLGDAIPAAATNPAATMPPVIVRSGPSPGVAGVLAGFFPFGVGQVYNGQYAKGVILAILYLGSMAMILVMMVLTTILANAACLFCLPAFILPMIVMIYAIYDAYDTAEKINNGIPVRDWL